MFLLIAGKSPFKGSTYDEVVMRNYHCKIDYPSIENIISNAGTYFIIIIIRIITNEIIIASSTIIKTLTTRCFKTWMVYDLSR